MSAVVDAVKNALGFYGGELAELEQRIKTARKKLSPPKEVEEAQRQYDKLTSDLQFRGDCLSIRERELLAHELPVLEALLKEWTQAMPLRERALKDLFEQKRSVENQILYWKNRKQSLLTHEKPLIEQRIEENRHTLEADKAAIDAARREIADHMTDLDLKINELTAKKKAASPSDQASLETEIQCLSAAKQKNLMEIIPIKQRFINEKLERVKSLELTIKKSQDSLRDALEECGINLLRLYGRPE